MINIVDEQELKNLLLLCDLDEAGRNKVKQALLIAYNFGYTSGYRSGLRSMADVESRNKWPDTSGGQNL